MADLRFTVYGSLFTAFKMFAKFRHRSYELEHLYKGDYTPEEYEGCIVELQRVNQWLGDAQALRSSLLQEVESLDL